MLVYRPFFKNLTAPGVVEVHGAAVVDDRCKRGTEQRHFRRFVEMTGSRVWGRCKYIKYNKYP